MSDPIYTFNALWPGVAQVLSGNFTLLQGITPSVCTLEILPQLPDVALDGDLVLVFGATTITFTQCRVDKGSFRYDSSGMVVSLSIWDRRWKWRYAEPITGAYNTRYDTIQSAPGQFNGSIDPDSLQTPWQLAELCFDALQEEGYDLTQLPNETYPEVLWDQTNSAQALNDLVESLGCRIVLNLDDTISIAREGVGADLPVTQVMRQSVVQDPPDPPDLIRVVGARKRYNVDFVLEPVGLDTDGVIKPIYDLSYMPDVTWAVIDPFDPVTAFQQVEGWTPGVDIYPSLPPNFINAATLGFINPRQLASDTVWRWYRIDLTRTVEGAQPLDPSKITGGDLAWQGFQQGAPRVPNWRTFPEGDQLTDLWQVLPIEDVQVVGFYTPENVFTPFPAWVIGQFWSDDLLLKNTDPNSFCYKDFTIDKETGIVKFSEPVVLILNKEFVAARLVLRCAVSVRDIETAVFDRYVFEKDLTAIYGSHQTGPLVLEHPEIIYGSVPSYDENYRVTNATTTDQQNEAEAAYYADAQLFQFQLKEGQDVTYMGFLPIECDGAVKQVTWSWGPQGATTRVGWNTEWHPVIPGYRERLMYARAEQNEQNVRSLINQRRREGGK